jgi:hypothetical protein
MDNAVSRRCWDATRELAHFAVRAHYGCRGLFSSVESPETEALLARAKAEDERFDVWFDSLDHKSIDSPSKLRGHCQLVQSLLREITEFGEYVRDPDSDCNLTFETRTGSLRTVRSEWLYLEQQAPPGRMVRELWDAARKLHTCVLPMPAMLTAQDAIGALDQLVRWCVSNERARATDTRSADDMAVAEADTPRRLLSGWGAIREALGLPKDHQNNLRNLNKRLNGPIRTGSRGKQAIAHHDELIDWWNKLAILQQDQENRQAGRIAAASASFDYGREGTVSPEIGGHQKTRRGSRRKRS